MSSNQDYLLNQALSSLGLKCPDSHDFSGHLVLPAVFSAKSPEQFQEKISANRLGLSREFNGVSYANQYQQEDDEYYDSIYHPSSQDNDDEGDIHSYDPDLPNDFTAPVNLQQQMALEQAFQEGFEERQHRAALISMLEMSAKTMRDDATVYTGTGTMDRLKHMYSSPTPYSPDSPTPSESLSDTPEDSGINSSKNCTDLFFHFTTSYPALDRLICREYRHIDSSVSFPESSDSADLAFSHRILSMTFAKLLVDNQALPRQTSIADLLSLLLNLLLAAGANDHISDEPECLSDSNSSLVDEELRGILLTILPDTHLPSLLRDLEQITLALSSEDPESVDEMSLDTDNLQSLCQHNFWLFINNMPMLLLAILAFQHNSPLTTPFEHYSKHPSLRSFVEDIATLILDQCPSHLSLPYLFMTLKNNPNPQDTYYSPHMEVTSSFLDTCENVTTTGKRLFSYLSHIEGSEEYISRTCVYKAGECVSFNVRDFVDHLSY